MQCNAVPMQFNAMFMVGQALPVSVTRLVYEGTIEARILAETAARAARPTEAAAATGETNGSSAERASAELHGGMHLLDALFAANG